MVIAIIVAFVVVIHVQWLVSVYLSLVKIKYSACVKKKKLTEEEVLVITQEIKGKQFHCKGYF